MISSQPANRASLSRAFWCCLLTLVFLVGLNFIFVTTIHAQSNLIIVQNNVAKVRYREGIQFNVTATIQGGQVNSAELKLKFGKNGREETDNIEINNGVATYFISEDSGSIATGMPVIFSWVLSDGQVQLQTDSQTVVYQDQTHTWIQVEGPHVTVRWYNGDNSYGQLMYQLAADALSTYKRRFYMDPQDQIYITIYGSGAAYHSTFPDVPDWSGGFSKYGGIEIVAIAPQDHNSSVFIGEGIPHELSHAALYQFLNGAAPRWLDEGFAVYNQNVISIEQYDDMLKQAYQANSLIPLASLDKKWPAAEDAALLAYAEGRSIVTFLINTYGNDVWANVLDQLRRNTADGAFNAIFGVNLSTMEGLWKSSVLGGQKVTMPVALKTGPVPSQPTIEDYSTSTGTSTIDALGKGSPQSQTGSNLFWLMLGLGVGAILILALLSFLVIRRTRREASMHRFRRWPEETAEDVDVYSRLSNFQNPSATALPAVPAPMVNRMPLPPAPTPFNQPNTWQPTSHQIFQPNMPPPPFGAVSQPLHQTSNLSVNGSGKPSDILPWLGNPSVQSQVPSPVQPSGGDPFDFISARFEPKPQPGTTYAAGAFLELDPYGLNFEPIKNEVKDKQV